MHSEDLEWVGDRRRCLGVGMGMFWILCTNKRP